MYFRPTGYSLCLTQPGA